MLKGIEFLLKKSREKVEGGKELSSPAPVILCPVHRIFWQRVANLVNKFALLFKRSMFAQDSRDKPENDGCWGRWFSVCCEFFKYPSPADKSTTSPSGGEVSYGRSMIEMLGVLAIIAVLSVGGIAGYSKAMLMWHSDKQKDLLVELINNAITLKPNLSSIKGNSSINITDIFAAMGAIPSGFTYKNRWIYDLDNNSISITYGIDNDRLKDGSTKQVFKYAIRIYAIEGTGKLSISMKEYCKNIIQIVQTIPNEVQSVDFSSIDSDSWSGTSGVLIFNLSTVGQTSPAQINERCNIAIKENGRGYFRILLNPD